jgi:hypothetical protein
MIFPVFDSIRNQLVSEDNPARDGGDMDYERCAALHNAIVKHGWMASGHSLGDLPLKTCWQVNEEEWEEDANRLHPSMIEFLKRAYNTELPDTEPLYNFMSRIHKFFYFLDGLVGPQNREAFDLDAMTLYTANDDLGSHAQGLMYDTSLTTGTNY